MQNINSLYLILFVSIGVVIVLASLFVWAVRSGQWDDLDTPAERLLTEELDEQR